MSDCYDKIEENKILKIYIDAHKPGYSVYQRDKKLGVVPVISLENVSFSSDKKGLFVKGFCGKEDARPIGAMQCRKVGYTDTYFYYRDDPRSEGPFEAKAVYLGGNDYLLV